MKMPSSTATIKIRGARKYPMSMVKVAKNKIEKPKVEIGVINGRTPDSSYEWNIALALWKYEWKFYYQLEVLGGKDVRGGQVLDFLVFTRPFYTALSVIGGYWHRNSQAEQLKDSQMIKGLRAMGYPVASEVLHAFDENASTPDDAAAFIYRSIGRS